jgi:hypothetical protein
MIIPYMSVQCESNDIEKTKKENTKRRHINRTYHKTQRKTHSRDK